MIRRSTAIATVAILLSLFVHFIGLGFTSRSQSEKNAEPTTTDVIALDNTFEDVAEAVSEPVEPEPAPVPEPPVEQSPEPEPEPEPELEPEPEPEQAEAPTSKALVASSNPQHTLSPDTGEAHVVRPDTAGPAKPVESGVPEPETLEPSSGDAGRVAEAIATPPVEPGSTAEAPLGNPDASVEPVEATSIEPASEPSISPTEQPNEPQRLAALPAPLAPTLPAIQAPEPSAVPIVPLENETVDPAISDTTVETVPEVSEPVETEDQDADLPPVASLRPQLPPSRPSVETRGAPDGSTDLKNPLRKPSRLIESPLSTYKRSRTDLIGRRSGGPQSGGSGFMESRGPGNSDVTNYVGRVLVHLNRVPPLRVSAKGWAVVLFEINPDGSLARVDVIDSSGSREVERVAKEQVRVGAPFPLPPNGVRRRISFVYRIN